MCVLPCIYVKIIKFDFYYHTSSSSWQNSLVMLHQSDDSGLNLAQGDFFPQTGHYESDLLFFFLTFVNLSKVVMFNFQTMSI